MTRDDWMRAKRQGRLAYVGWRVAPFALALLALAVTGWRQSEENWPLVLLAPLYVLAAVAHRAGVYDRTRVNYEDAETRTTHA